MFLRFAACCAASIALIVPALPSAALQTSPEVRIATFAGSGAAGFGDGSPGSFMMPFGLAYGPDGTLYVTDAGAQRVRAVDRQGRVRTIAGSGNADPTGLWVAGGYHDGPGREARFDRPAGIVWLGGKLYVADTNNHCIRVVAADGTVSTFAGSPQHPGMDNGSLATATFERPTGLAKDRAGNLYVADYFAVREIHDGQVTMVANFGSTPFSLSEVDTPDGPVLFVADLLGLERRMPDGTVERFVSTNVPPMPGRNIQGLQPLGVPFSVAAFDSASVVYGDVRGNSVRYLNWDAGSEQILAGLDVYDAASSAGGYHDGSGDQTRVDGPTGLAIAPNGTVAVADAGSRRIRLLQNLDRSHDARVAEAVPSSPPPKTAHRIAFIGNSFLWDYDRWSDSIPGIVEAKLRAAHDPSLGAFAVTPYIFPGAQVVSLADYARSGIAEMHLADVVVMDLATSNLYGMPDVPNSATSAQLIATEPSWTKQLTSSLHDADQILRRSGISLVVMTSPLPDNVSPVESLWNQLVSVAGQQPASFQIGQAMNQAVRASGVRTFDGFALFNAESRSPQHEALFGTQDIHFSRHGRAVLANGLASYLERAKPWQH